MTKRAIGGVGRFLHLLLSFGRFMPLWSVPVRTERFRSGSAGRGACAWARRQATWAGAVLVMLAGVATSFVSAPAVSAQDRHCHWDGDDGSWFDGGSWIGDCGGSPPTGDTNAWISGDDKHVFVDGGDAHSSILGVHGGKLSITNGGTLTSRGGTHVVGQGGRATVHISGPGSKWEATVTEEYGGVLVGYVSGSGTVILDRGGVLDIQGPGNKLVLSYAPASGLLVIGGQEGAEAIAPGFLNVGVVEMGYDDSGTERASGRIVFNHTDANYQFGPDVSGIGEIIQENGTTILNGTHTFRGTTVVNGGALRAGKPGAFSSDSHYVVNGGRLELNGHSLTMKSLSGDGGEVVLGTVPQGSANVTLTIDQEADTTFHGDVKGPANVFSAGSVVLEKDGGGSLTLTGQGTLSNVYNNSGVRVKGGTLVLADGGTMRAHWLMVANDGQDATLRIVGSGSQFSAAGPIDVGAVDGEARVSIEDGGVLKSSMYASIGQKAGATGRVSLSGGSTWEHGSSNFLVGDKGTGVLTIADGSRVTSQAAEVGYEATARGTVTVSGTGAEWLITSQNMFIGSFGTGEINVANGGKVVVGSNGPRRSLLVGHEAGGSGRVTVAGTNSLLEAAEVIVGYNGAGELIVSDAGQVKAPDVSLGKNLASSGTLRIGSGGAAGALDVRNVTFGEGEGRLVFDHTDVNYTFGAPLEGGDDRRSELRHENGTTRLTGDNSLFRGKTTVAGGTLIVEGSLSGPVEVTAGGTLGGNGIVGATTVKEGGTIAPGAGHSVMPFRTLTVNGDLMLHEGATIRLALGEPGTAVQPEWGWNGRLDVRGNLTLDGTVDLTDGGDGVDKKPSFGYYRLLTYDGDLIDNGIAIGAMPDVVGSIPQLQMGDGRVDLFIGAVGDDELQHWQGGDGVWDATAANWLNQDGEVPVPWAGNHAVFKDEPGGFDGGVVTVEGVQSFAGLQFVDDGYLLTGSGTLETAAEGAEIRVLADRADIATVIGGTGGLVKTEAGTLVLAGRNTYRGGTRLVAGTLQIAEDDNLGDASGDLVFAGGALRVTGGGAEHGRDVVTMARRFTLESTGVVDVGREDGTGDVVLEWTGIISGSGGLVKMGEGELVLAGAENTYGGGTLVQQGMLTVTGAGALGSGDVVVTGAGSQLSVRGVAVGSRTVSVEDGARLSLHAGADAAETVVRIGENAVVDVSEAAGSGGVDRSPAVGSVSGAGRVVIGDRGIIVGALGRHDVYTGVIDDGGAGGGLVKVGSGVFILEGDQRYGGETVVQGGTLRVDGSIASSSHVTVQQGGTLTGSGTVGTTAVEGGGTFLVGTAGPFTVAGDLTFSDDSSFAVAIDPGDDGGPFVHVKGNVRLSGGSVVHVGEVAEYKADATYRLLQADGALVGRFEQVTSNFAFLAPELLYDESQGRIDLRLLRNNIRFQDKASTGNRRAVARAVETLGGDHPVYRAVAALHDDPDAIDEAFDSLSGEVHAEAVGQLFRQGEIVGDTVSARIHRGDGAGFMDGSLVYLGGLLAAGAGDEAGDARGDDVVDWVRIVSSKESRRGDGNAAGFEVATSGLIVGADKPVGPNRSIGVVVGYTVTEVDMAARDSHMTVDNGHVGLYGKIVRNRWSFGGSLAYSRQRVTTERTVRAGTLTNSLTARYEGSTAGLRVEASYSGVFANVDFTPFLQLSLAAASRAGFEEEGGAAALTVDGESRTSVMATSGLRMGAPVAVGGVKMYWRGLVAWTDPLGGERGAESSHRFDGGEKFAVAGLPDGRSGLHVAAGLDIRITEDVTATIDYAGRFGALSPDQSVTTALGVRF